MTERHSDKDVMRASLYEKVLVLLFLPLETILQQSRFWLEVSAVSALVGFALVILGINFQVRADAEEDSLRNER
jgi:hypothetical protein